MTEEDRAFIIKVVTELCKKDTGIDWTAIGSIGAVAAGVAAIWAILSNDRPRLIVNIPNVKPQLSYTFRDSDGFALSSQSAQEIEIINKGSRRAHRIKVNTGQHWLFFDLEAGDRETVTIDPLRKHRKITYGHWNFPLIRYYAVLSNNISHKKHSSWRSGNLHNLEGRKRLRLFLQKIEKESVSSDNISMEILKTNDGFILIAKYDDANKNVLKREVRFAFSFREALIYLWPLISVTEFIVKDQGYNLSVETLTFKKLRKQLFGFWKFEIFPKMSYPPGVSEDKIVDTFKDLGKIRRLPKDVAIMRSRVPNRKYIAFIDSNNPNDFNTIDLNDDRYRVKVGRYLLIFTSRNDFLLYSAFSFFPSVITAIDTKHRIIISNELESYGGKTVLSKEQWTQFNTYIDELKEFTVNDKRNRRNLKANFISFFGWISYTIYGKIE